MLARAGRMASFIETRTWFANQLLRRWSRDASVDAEGDVDLPWHSDTFNSRLLNDPAASTLLIRSTATPIQRTVISPGVVLTPASGRHAEPPDALSAAGATVTPDALTTASRHRVASGAHVSAAPAAPNAVARATQESHHTSDRPRRSGGPGTEPETIAPDVANRVAAAPVVGRPKRVIGALPTIRTIARATHGAGDDAVPQPERAMSDGNVPHDRTESSPRVERLLASRIQMPAAPSTMSRRVVAAETERQPAAAQPALPVRGVNSREVAKPLPAFPNRRSKGSVLPVVSASPFTTAIFSNVAAVSNPRVLTAHVSHAAVMRHLRDRTAAPIRLRQASLPDAIGVTPVARARRQRQSATGIIDDTVGAPPSASPPPATAGGAQTEHAPVSPAGAKELAVEDLVERVVQQLARDVAIEAERRGATSWLLRS